MSNTTPAHLRAAEARLKSVDSLVAAGYRQNADAINEELEILAHDSDIPLLLFNRMKQSSRITEMIGAQCFLVHSSENFYARLNFWLLKQERPDFIGKEFDQYFSIGVLHNHSFDFFTVGLLGPGYMSEFYTCTANLDEMKVGEIVPLDHAETLTLSKGKSIFVPKSTTFHIQYEPERYSVSLNIIPKRFDAIGSRDNTQFIVNPKTFAIDRRIPSSGNMSN